MHTTRVPLERLGLFVAALAVLAACADGAGGGTGGGSGGAGGGRGAGGGGGGHGAGDAGSVDDLTATGPCGQEQTTFDNPENTARGVHVFEPTGSAPAPLTGGTCDDDARPVLFLLHGNSADDPALFADLLHHFVSQGHIVVFPEHSFLDDVDLDGVAYPLVDAGLVAAAEHPILVERGDLAHVGFMGHSMGGGMIPYLLQQAEPRGWGSQSIWAMLIAPYWALAVGGEPTIDVPDDLRAMVVGFDRDATNDNAIGVEIFEALAIPDDQKDYVLVVSDESGDPALLTHHTLPQTKESAGDSSPRPDDALRIHGIYRNANALAACARFGTRCAEDLTYMGAWPDAHLVAPAVVTDDPVDSGTGAFIPCTSGSNPRSDHCP